MNLHKHTLRILWHQAQKKRKTKKTRKSMEQLTPKTKERKHLNAKTKTSTNKGKLKSNFRLWNVNSMK